MNTQRRKVEEMTQAKPQPTRAEVLAERDRIGRTWRYRIVHDRDLQRRLRTIATWVIGLAGAYFLGLTIDHGTMSAHKEEADGFSEGMWVMMGGTEYAQIALPLLFIFARLWIGRRTD